MTLAATFPFRGNLDYPTSDGKPMAESDWHRILMNQLIETLQRYCADDPDAYAEGNMLLYYERGNKRRHVSPDVFFVRGIEKIQRANYILWEEGKAPDIVVELTSGSTSDEDVEVKFALYRDVLKVTEYFLFDPKSEYLVPPQQGFRLIDGEYVPIEVVGGRMHSEVLGLDMERDGYWLRLVDPATGRRLPTTVELAHMESDRADAERARADAERTRADALAAELAALRAQLKQPAKNGY